jgi:hypothetical protein
MYSVDIAVLLIILSVCGIGGISVLEGFLLRFTNLRAIKPLFFVFRHVKKIYLLLWSRYVDMVTHLDIS